MIFAVGYENFAFTALLTKCAMYHKVDFRIHGHIYSMLPWQPFDVVRSYIFVYRPVNL